jgi:hypothetical protein
VQDRNASGCCCLTVGSSNQEVTFRCLLYDKCLESGIHLNALGKEVVLQDSLLYRIQRPCIGSENCPPPFPPNRHFPPWRYVNLYSSILLFQLYNNFYLLPLFISFFLMTSAVISPPTEEYVPYRYVFENVHF